MQIRLIRILRRLNVPFAVCSNCSDILFIDDYGDTRIKLVKIKCPTCRKRIEVDIGWGSYKTMLPLIWDFKGTVEKRNIDKEELNLDLMEYYAEQTQPRLDEWVYGMRIIDTIHTDPDPRWRACSGRFFKPQKSRRKSDES